ncbi:MAG: zinc ribbon domain-containing protein [Planctomycetota bacterium]
MPTYDYECSACSHEFELVQSMGDSKKKKCPECGRLKLVRLIGGGGAIIFKGSGFYTTDYRSESFKAGHKAAQESEKKVSEPASSSGGEKSESKTKDAAKASSPTKPDKSKKSP